MLHDLTRDDLVAFERGWLAKVGTGKGRVARRTAATYTKAVQYWLAWLFKRDTVVSRRIVGLDDIFKMTKVNPIQVADYAAVRDTLRLAATPFGKSMQGILRSLDDARTHARTAVINLLTKAIAVELGLPAGTGVSSVGCELVFAMQQHSLAVAPHGDSPDGFAAYFADQLNIQLPTATSANIGDAWIDDGLT